MASRLQSAAKAALAAASSAGRLVDIGVSVVNPGLAHKLSRERDRFARQVKAHLDPWIDDGLPTKNGYEGGKPSITRRVSRDHSTGERAAITDAAALRAQARHMERNHDLVHGALSTLVRNVVGPNGVGIEPTPRDLNDDINDQFARDLLNLWKDWIKSPEVTRTMDWAQCQQMACRSWLRDGEMLAQKVMGNGAAIAHNTQVALSLELLEADHLPLHYHRDNPNIVAGIERNAWGAPVAYWVHRNHPGDVRAALDIEPRRKPASVMLHLAMRTRISQLRGVCLFAPGMIRIDDIKSYEDSERIAARMAAKISAQVIRDPAMEGWTAPEVARERDPVTGQLKPRDFGMMEEGIIFDGLEPGEKFELLNPDRPNPNLEAFRNGQLRAGARGFELSYSAFSGNYDGTYSAQRQELVESWPSYQMLTGQFVAGFVRPIWETFVDLAIAQRLIAIPSGINRATLAQAIFRGPVMPWIDPQKEANALRLQLRAGITSATRVISDRGGRLQDVYEEIARERRLAGELGIQVDSDVATDKAPAGEPELIEDEDDKEGGRDVA